MILGSVDRSVFKLCGQMAAGSGPKRGALTKMKIYVHAGRRAFAFAGTLRLRRARRGQKSLTCCF
jgi:hypothetical protein